MAELKGKLKHKDYKEKFGGQQGNTGRYRGPKRSAQKVSRKARGFANRDAEIGPGWEDAEGEWHVPVPPEVKWVRAHPQRVKHRFTPVQWNVLVARYPQCHDGCGAYLEPVRSSVMVGRAMGMTGQSKQLREEEAKAMLLARELSQEWAPAQDKWHRIKSGHPRPVKGFDGGPVEFEQMTDADRAILAKHRRTDRPKKGRRAVERQPVRLQKEDAYDVGKEGPIRFNQLSGKQRREMGVEEVYGDGS